MPQVEILTIKRSQIYGLGHAVHRLQITGNLCELLANLRVLKGL